MTNKLDMLGREPHKLRTKSQVILTLIWIFKGTTQWSHPDFTIVSTISGFDGVPL